MTVLENVLRFCNELDKRHASYRISVDRPEAIRVTVDVPREVWEFEFFPDGEIELERYIAQDVVVAGPTDLEAVLRYYDDAE
jgi:hypothetical protein